MKEIEKLGSFVCMCVIDLYLYFFITIVDANSYEIMFFPYGHYKFTDIS